MTSKIEQAILKNILRDVREPLPSDLRRYFEALGQFVTMFSLLKSTMQETLWHFAGVSPPLAPAIFSGTRIDAATQHIKRISEATGWSKEQRAFFDELTLQIGEITRTRNDLLHCGIQGVDTDNLSISNAQFAHINERIRTTKISTLILDQMSGDLMVIGGILAHLIRKAHYPPAGLLKGLWRYKAERQRGPSQ